MRIAVIGAGNIGGNLALRLAGLGHQVTVANSRVPGTLAALAAQAGAQAALASQAAAGADLVIVAVPQRAIPALPAGFLDGALPGAPVVDAGNYYPRERDGLVAAIEAGMPESQWVSEQLGHPVVKTFNTVYARHLLDRGLPAGAPGRIALPVAGDEPDAKAAVMGLVDQLGFDPVDAGPLAGSWRQQPGTPVYGTELDADGVIKALAAASRQRQQAFRA